MKYFRHTSCSTKENPSMRPFIVLLLCLLPAVLYAQLNSPLKYTLIKWDHGMMISGSPMLAFGVEHRMGKYGVGVTGAYHIPAAYQFTDTFKGAFSGKTTGYSFRLNVFRYLPAKKGRFDLLMGGELFYTRFSQVSSYDYRDTLGGGGYNGHEIYDKEMYGFAIVFGAQHHLSRHLMAQMYLGPGLKIKTVQARVGMQPGYEVWSENPAIEVINQTGTHLNFAAPFHFSLGYYF